MNYPFKYSFKAVTHQTDIKELAAKKADCVVALRQLHLSQKKLFLNTMFLEQLSALLTLSCTDSPS